MSSQNIRQRIKRAAEQAKTIATVKANAESFLVTPESRQQAEAELIEWHRAIYESLKDTEPFSVVVGELPKSWEEVLREEEEDIHRRFAELPAKLNREVEIYKAQNIRRDKRGMKHA